MNVLMIIRIAFRALARNKTRASLTMLCIIIGVSAVIVMVSIGQGAQASVQAQIESMGTNLLFVTARAQLVVADQNWNTSVQGVSEQLPDIRKWSVQDGGFFTDADVRSAARV